MSDLLTILLCTLGAGVCIPLGGLLARVEHIRPYWLEQELRHFLIALGGGILLGAVAQVLIPEGMGLMPDPLWGIGIFIVGGLCFFLLEWFLGLRRREAPQLTGMLLDYIPEALALGGLFATGSNAAPLLALLIGLQNLPEGFNAYRELIPLNHYSPKKTLLLMSSLIFVGPLAGIIGFYSMSHHQDVLGGLMLFASGGILYLVFQDIAPQSRLEKHWAPPMGAVLGFSITLICQMLLDV